MTDKELRDLRKQIKRTDKELKNLMKDKTLKEFEKGLLRIMTLIKSITIAMSALENIQ